MSPQGTRWNELDVKPHGTVAAYRRHYRHGTRPCEACKQARRLARGAYEAIYQAERRERYRIAREAGLSFREAGYAKDSPERLAAALAERAGEERMTGHKCPFDVPIISEIADNLWQGGCEDGLILPERIRHLLSLYRWERYDAHHRLRTSHVVTMHDSAGQDTSRVDRWARWVNARRKTGPVLVHCQAGLNRSSLVVARALMLDGMTAGEAIGVLREKRSPAALCNPAFEAWLRAQDGRP